MDVVTEVALGLLLVAAALVLGRLVRGPSLADRVVALDALFTLIVSGIVVAAARDGDGTYLDVPVVAALLGFLGTAMVARFVERRGAR